MTPTLTGILRWLPLGCQVWGKPSLVRSIPTRAFNFGWYNVSWTLKRCCRSHRSSIQAPSHSLHYFRPRQECKRSSARFLTLLMWRLLQPVTALVGHHGKRGYVASTDAPPNPPVFLCPTHPRHRRCPNYPSIWSAVQSRNVAAPSW